MRRLVDVDELIKYFDEDLEGYDNREYILQMLDTKGRIERVEAIPIEWIDRFMNRFRTPEGVSGDEYALIHYMLCEWEKENEQEASD